MKDVDNIVSILRSAKVFVEEDDANKLKTLSNQTVHDATISQDGDSIVVAVLIYSLGKVMERAHYRDMKGWNDFYNSVVGNLKKAANNFSQKDDSGEPDNEKLEKARENLGEIRNSLNKVEGNLGTYIKDVFRKAEINKAFRLYEHGLSSEATAKLLGVSLWDLASYIGQSHIGDAKVAICLPEKERIRNAEEFFG